ncbi:MAG: nitroreductase family protein [Desulfobacterales bacterium]
MNSFDQLVAKRRSIRKYTPEIPPEELICQMIACAGMAPSPSNIQPVRFIRIQSGNVKNLLQQRFTSGSEKLLVRAKALKNGKRLLNLVNAYKRYSAFMFYAPVLFAVGVIKGGSGFSKTLLDAGLLKEDLRGETDLDISIGLALKGFILKGESIGLGSCILTAPLVFMDDMEAIIGLPDISVKCFITTGYPDETPSCIEKKAVKEIYMEI